MRAASRRRSGQAEESPIPGLYRRRRRRRRSCRCVSASISRRQMVGRHALAPQQGVELAVGDPAGQPAVRPAGEQLDRGPLRRPVRRLGDPGADADPADAERGQLGDRRRARADQHVERSRDRRGELAQHRRVQQPGDEDPVRTGRRIGLRAPDRLGRPAGLLADAAQVDVGPRVDEQRHPGRVRRRPGRGDPLRLLGDVPQRRPGVLQVDPDRAGLEDQADGRRDVLRPRAEAGLDVRGHRHRDRGGDPADRLDRQLPGQPVPVRRAQAPGDAAAGGGHRRGAGPLDQARGRGIPHVGQHQDPVPVQSVELGGALGGGHAGIPPPATDNSARPPPGDPATRRPGPPTAGSGRPRPGARASGEAPGACASAGARRRRDRPAADLQPAAATRPGQPDSAPGVRGPPPERLSCARRARRAGSAGPPRPVPRTPPRTSGSAGCRPPSARSPGRRSASTAGPRPPG